MPAPIKPEISHETFSSVDLRVGTIQQVEDVPNSDKLVRLIVSFGDHTRRILTGIKKERPNPQELTGRQALFVVNVKPRKMAGEISEGMIVDVGYADGLIPAPLLQPEKPVADGTRAG